MLNRGKLSSIPPQEFSSYADKISDNITSLYMSVDEVLEVPAETEEAPVIPQTLQIHKVERTHDVCCLKFSIIASDNEPMIKQYYRNDTVPEICDHKVAGVDDNTCSYCLEYYIRNEGLERLRCQLCSQCFHEKCFELLFGFIKSCYSFLDIPFKVV